MDRNLLCDCFGLLIGNPVVGAIVKDNWVGLQVWCAAVLIIASILCLATRIAKTGLVLKMKPSALRLLFESMWQRMLEAP